MMKKIITTALLGISFYALLAQETNFSTNFHNALGIGFSDKPTWVYSFTTSYKINGKWAVNLDFYSSSHTELRNIVSQDMQVRIDYVYASTYQVFATGMNYSLVTKNKSDLNLQFGLNYAFHNYSEMLDNSSYFDDFYWAPNKHHYFGIQSGLAYRWNLTSRFFLEFKSTLFYYPIETKIMNSNGISFGIHI